MSNAQKSVIYCSKCITKRYPSKIIDVNIYFFVSTCSFLPSSFHTMFPLGGDQACDINFLLFTTEGENVQDISAQWRFCLKAWMLDNKVIIKPSSIKHKFKPGTLARTRDSF